MRFLFAKLQHIKLKIHFLSFLNAQRFTSHLTKIVLASAEASGEPETGPPVPMEDMQKEKCIMGQVQDNDGTTQGQPLNENDQGSVMAEEELGAEIMEERGTEKGMDEGELQKDVQLEAEMEKIELWRPEWGLQLNYIHGSDLVGYVGIEAVLDQMRNKTMKVGFDFNIMVVGK